jgi:gamma-butyrobetaine dioxygenase
MACARSLNIQAASKEEAGVRVTWSDGSTHFFHYIYLRDNCCSSITKNGQRTFESWTLPPNKELARTAKLEASDTAIHIVWEADGSSHLSEFGSQWLRDNQYDGGEQVDPAAETIEVLWDAASIGKIPSVLHDDVVKGGTARFQMLQALKKYGFVRVRGCPAESGTVVKFGDTIGFVRRTNYGNVFNVQNLPDGGNNMAYTSLGLSVHTDNPYRDPTPGVQLLHCITPAEGGGKSMLVDGFAVAERVRKEYPKAFEILSTTPRPFRFVDRGDSMQASTEETTADMRACWPTISLTAAGAVDAVHYNNRSAGSIAPIIRQGVLKSEDVPLYYEAWQAFGRLVNDPHYECTFQLEAGDLLIMQNNRVLHGRTSFMSDQQRWLQGCYIDIDQLWSQLRLHEHAAANVSE